MTINTESSFYTLRLIGRTGMAFLMAVMIAGWTTTPAFAEDISVTYNFYEDWGSGACAEAWVTNQGSTRADWEATVDLGHPVSHHWNSERLGSNEAANHTYRFMGAHWNRSLEAGASTAFGFCIDRTSDPTHNPWENTVSPVTAPDPHQHMDHPMGDCI